jgi:methyltransferase-like protein/predicted O-methyltransferase YrrM
MMEIETGNGPAAARPMATDYDLVPYESCPHPATHIAHLHSIGRLFGMAPADLRRCRVLELGSAAGGNLIPMAIEYPDSEFIGIDLSSREIDDGKRHLANLDLGNIDLRWLSIMDIDAGFGQFDYIICHGVFSWVPSEVQEKILAICKERLAPHGIAIVSYNTLPGWNVVRTVREMMLYHGKRFPEPAERARQARLLLDFVREAGGGKTTPYMGMLQQEIELLRRQADSYLLHDHLSETNTPSYFHQFIEKAQANGLQYVGDTALSSMYVGNLPQSAAEQLAAVGDIVRQEQYMDFIQNRRFRSTLLCHQTVTLNRNLTPDRMEDFYWRTSLMPDKPIDEAGEALNGPLTFTIPGSGIALRTNDPLSSRAFYMLTWQKQLSVKPVSLIRQTAERFGIADTQGLRRALLDPAPRLVLAGAITLHAEEAKWVVEISERPVASKLARYQATYSTWLTNQRHERVDVNPVSRVILSYLDGTNDRPAIVAKLTGHVIKGELDMQQGGKPIADPDEIGRHVAAALDRVLASMAARCVLVA